MDGSVCFITARGGVCVCVCVGVLVYNINAHARFCALVLVCLLRLGSPRWRGLFAEVIPDQSGGGADAALRDDETGTKGPRV